MKTHKNLIQILGVAILALCSLTTLKAQTITGNVNGTVTDPSGAVVPNAKVTATNVDTGVTTETTTNGEGIYNIRFLQIGNYKVVVDASGFAPSTFGPFVLETNGNVKVDAQLALAGQVQKVSVESSFAPLINTENPTLATTLDTRAIENVPLVSRNIIALTAFLPGAISTNPNGLVNNASVSGPISANSTVSVNGNRQQVNQYLLDGININQTLDDIPGYNPSLDAVNQVQIISANAPAEYGNVLGGDVLYQTKSGTNQFHGSGFFSLGNQLLNANTWGNKHVSNASLITPRGPFTRDIFGGTIGGPVFKDRLFFFFDYQGGRYHSGGVGTATVLTAKERHGDFSELLDPSLMCSSTGGVCSGNSKLIRLYNATAAGSPIYTNNQLPSTPLNPALVYLFAHPEIYPLPNKAPTPTNTPASGNYQGPTKSRNYGNQFDAKIDWKATQKDNLSVRYSWANQGATSQSVLPTSFTSAPTFPVRGIAINEVHTISPSMINEFRAGYTRLQNLGAVLLDRTGVFGLNGDKILGIGANNPIDQQFASFSVLAFGNSASPQGFSSTNGTEYTNLGNQNTGTNYTINTFQYGDTFTWLKNRHSFKMGVQFLRQQQNNFYPGNDGSLGGFFFLGPGTSYFGAATDPQGYGTGYAAADMYLDRAGFKSKGGVAGPVGMRQWRDAYFFQDDWKVLPTLTLNLGVRYEYSQPIYEVNHKMSTIDPANPGVIIIDNDNTAVCQASGLPCVTAKSAGYGRGLVDPFYGSFMPRIGFAWNAIPKFVVRGGYGLENDMEGTGANLRMTTNLPFQAAFQGSASQATSTTPGSFFRIEDGMGSGAAASNTWNVWNKKIKPAFIGFYNLTMEYQVTNTASFQVGYVGESGQHLVSANQRNQLPTPCVVNGVVQTVSVAVPTGTAATCPTIDPAPFQKTPGVLYNGVVRYTDSNGMMNYNAMQASFRQRAWHGLQYTANYTYAHALTNSTGFYGVPSISAQSAYAENPYNMHAEYGNSGYDVRHALNWNMVYDLPLGRGRMVGSSMPFILDEIVGGWRIGMTGIAYTGFPVNITATNNSATNGNSQRANHYMKMKITNRSLNNWFGTDPSAVPCTVAGSRVNSLGAACAYGQPALGTFGNSAVSSERAPGFQTYGAEVTKDFTIWHEHKINFRADADNVFNSAYWSNPGNNASTTSFGQITSVRSGPRQMQLEVKYHF